MLSSNGIRAIFFDLDGTLRHSLPLGGEVFASYAAQLGLPLRDEDRLHAARWEQLYWASSADLDADLQKYREENKAFWVNYSRRQLAALGASSQQAEDLALQVSDYMEQSYRPESVIPEDVLRVLPKLKGEGYKLGVISNRDKPYQQEIESLGIASYFVFSLAGGEVNAFKPDPQIFIHGCERAEVSPPETVYVGDNYFADVVGARRAGLQPVLYDPRGIFPDADCAIIKSFDELPDILK
ncbi:MAG TPA: HAD family hydrolase [Anaerolineales bacterium]|nr:HAD family hydrolase [Anaerolineales bacterium]